MENYLSAILNACVPLIITLIGIATVAISIGIAKFASYLKVKTDDVMLQYAIAATEAAAINVVQSLNQTVVNDLKNASEDGKLTQEEVITISTSALNMLKESLSSETIKAIEGAFGNLDTYLSNLIEKTVLKCKDPQAI